MKIGQLASKADCSVETIRYYEKEGLLHPPLRDIENNYRRYNNAHLEKLLFIRRCRSLDMTHEEIRELLLAINSHNQKCSPVDEIIEAHLTHVQHRIKELIELEKQLIELKEFCSADRNIGECGIIQKLTTDDKEEDLPIATPTEHLGGVH